MARTRRTAVAARSTRPVGVYGRRYERCGHGPAPRGVLRLIGARLRVRLKGARVIRVNRCLGQQHGNTRSSAPTLCRGPPAPHESNFRPCNCDWQLWVLRAGSGMCFFCIFSFWLFSFDWNLFLFCFSSSFVSFFLFTFAVSANVVTCLVRRYL